MNIETYEINAEGIKKEYEQAKEYLTHEKFAEVEATFEEKIKIPFKRLTPRGVRILKVACRNQCKPIEKFNYIIPAKILKLCKEEMELKYVVYTKNFSQVLSMDSIKVVNFLIGISKTYDYYMIGQWGNILISDDSLKFSAIGILDEIISSKCEEYKNNSRHHAEKYLDGEALYGEELILRFI